MKKNIFIIKIINLIIFIGFINMRVFAQERELSQINRQIEILTEEIEKIKLGSVAEPKYESFMGLGPAASKIYFVDSGVSIGGYGEVVYENYQNFSKKDFADALRFILYVGYKYNDWIIMNAELEFEHAGIKNVSPRQPEVYTEFVYLDFLFRKEFNVMTGLILMPVGIVNEFHEPTVFNGVLRPDVERMIIPSTWRDLGVMVHGGMGDLKYKIGLVNGLRAELFKKSDWIRSGRQQGAEINADSVGGVVRLDYEFARNFNVGGAYYLGRANEGKGRDSIKTNEVETNVNLWEIHYEYQIKGLKLKGLYASGLLDGNDAMKNNPPKSVGKEVQGWYLEIGYDIMPFIQSESIFSLTPFIRYENYDTHKEVFSGSRDETQNRQVTTVGFGFKPHSNVILKMDYQWRDTASVLPEGKGSGFDENKIDQFNLSIGFIF